jgi:hypothetical protein
MECRFKHWVLMHHAAGEIVNFPCGACSRMYGMCVCMCEKPSIDKFRYSVREEVRRNNPSFSENRVNMVAEGVIKYRYRKEY